jgi:hypothetical protein
MQITRNHCKQKDFVCSLDERDVISSKFEYRYGGICTKGWTLLHYALAYNQVEMMELLIHQGAGQV